MRSQRLRVMAALVKPVARRRMEKVQDASEVRRMFDRASRFLFRAPPHALYLEAEYASDKMRSALWVSAAKARRDKVILYLHGGGYLAGTPWQYRKLVAHLSRAAGVQCFVPSYRLAPEHPMPAAVDDALAAFDHLLRVGYRPQDIVIGGDSAGGGLCFAVLSALCQRGDPPAGAFGWCPCLDMTYSGLSVHENAARDHLFPGDRVKDLLTMILKDVPANDPRNSPLFAEYPDCSPVLLQVADTEILRDDATRMEAKLRGQGTQVRLEMWKAAPHVWHFMCGSLPEAQQAIDNTADFIAQQLSGSSSDRARGS
ncbi:MAG: alpha/beta hydrolase [Sulfitobacter sp.]